jgi:hypothetical protein
MSERSGSPTVTLCNRRLAGLTPPRGDIYHWLDPDLLREMPGIRQDAGRFIRTTAPDRRAGPRLCQQVAQIRSQNWFQRLVRLQQYAGSSRR